MEAPGVKTLRLRFENEEEGNALNLKLATLPNIQLSARANARSASPLHLPAKGMWNAHSARLAV